MSDGENMSRTILLSFLGTNNYVECYYTFNGQKGKLVEYIQEDLIEREKDNLDKVYIFTTQEAHVKNWENYIFNVEEGENKGLKERLREYNFVEEVNIPMGNSEDEIWKIFQILYEKIEENDTIIFDITHAFRSLPMLAMVFLNYAKILKNIKVERIYYGAFEVLGQAREVKEWPFEKRIAPILDLTSFNSLQEWSIGVYDFIYNGNVKKISELTKQTINPILKETRGQDEVARNLRTLSEQLAKFIDILKLNRGKDLYTFNFEHLEKALESLKANNNLILPLTPLLEKIELQIRKFSISENVKRGFVAVEWLLDNGLYQQAITMLQENIVSYFLQKDNRDYGDRTEREIVTSLIKVINQNIDEKEWNDNLKSNNITKNSSIFKLMEQEKELLKDLDKLTSIRNDINHGGMRTNIGDSARSADTIKREVQELKKQIFNKLGINNG